MRNFIQAALTLTILVRALPSMADQSYVVQSISPEGSNLLFEIGYTAGVHKGSASQVEGLVNFDANNQLTLANFTVPLSSLSTGNSTRDCHMREALGINYELSNFPKDHVCEAGDVLPSSGPNSVAYPTIEFEFSKLASSSLPLPSVLVPGQVYTSVPSCSRTSCR